MKIKFFVLFFLFPIVCLAQLKTLEIKSREIEAKFKISREPDLEEAYIIFIYAPTLDDIKFKANMGWIVGKEPKYNEETYRWELYLPLNQRNEIKVYSKGFNEGKIVVPNSSKKELIAYEIFEKDLNIPPKLTITANPPDAKISIRSYPQEGIIEERTLVAGTYVKDGLSAGTVRVLLEKEGYSPKDSLFVLKNGDEITAAFSLVPKTKFVRIESNPSGSKFFFDTNLNKEETTLFNGSIPGNTRKLTFKKNDYFEDYILELPAESGGVIPEVILKRKKSKGVVFDNDIDEILIDGKSFLKEGGTFTIDVDQGELPVRVEMGNFKAFDDNNKKYKFNKEEENLGELQIRWRNYFYNQKVAKKQKSLSTVSFVVGLAGIGSGLYLMQSANKNYDAYKKATSSTEAASLRKQVESADRLSPITLGIGGLFTGVGIVFLLK